MADLFEVLIGTGMRKGGALGLHWDDVHLDKGVLYIRCTLSAIDNNPSAPPHHPPPAPRRTSPGPGVRPHCDQHAPGRTKSRPLTDERTASDLRFRIVGTTGFEPATP
ncbi:hypothetical protein ACIREO_08165 [Streptomyces sp. NPDC102441]|uniref:hypothetical protein n=1 Tax=Streptomyces sp. NPDC102441 TaxID=3366176 RepID=UPI00381979AC